MQSVPDPGTPTEPNTSRGTTQGPTTSLIRRRTVVAGAAWATPAVIGLSAVPAWALSPQCVSTGHLFTSQAGGALLSAYVGTPTLLDAFTIAVDNPGADGSATVVPTSASANGTDAWYRPFTLSLLNSAITVSLPPVSNLLQLGFNTPVGALNAYGAAHATTGYVPFAHGASGVVSNGGVISTNNAAITQPDLATLQLKTALAAILGSSVSTLVAGLADIWLQIGAVAAEAKLTNVQGCSTTQDPYAAKATVTREYILAALRLILSVPTLPGLWTAVTTAVNGLVTTLNAAVGTLVDLIDAVPDVSASYSGINFADLFTAIKNFFANGIIDSSLSPHPLATIDLTTGTIAIDLAALLGVEKGGDGASLNGLPPNTQLVLNSDAVNTLTNTITTGLATLLTGLLDTSAANGNNSVLEGILSSAKITITISPVTGGTFTAQLSLLDFLRGNPTLSYTGGNAGITTAVGLVNTVLATSGPVLGLAVQALLTGLATVLTGPTGALNVLTNTIVNILSGLVSGLQLDKVLSLLVNAQSDGTTGQVTRKNVSALLLTLLDTSSTPLVTLDLAHAYAGEIDYLSPVTS